MNIIVGVNSLHLENGLEYNYKKWLKIFGDLRNAAGSCRQFDVACKVA